MSELTLCNRCTLDRITRDASRRGQQVRCERVPITEEMGGWYKVTLDDKPVAWFMELTERCAC